MPRFFPFANTCQWKWKIRREKKTYLNSWNFQTIAFDYGKRSFNNRKFKTQKTFSSAVKKSLKKIKKLLHGRANWRWIFNSLFSGRVWIHWLKNFFGVCRYFSLLNLITIHLLLNFEASTTVCFMLASFVREKHAQQLWQRRDFWWFLQLLK